MTHDLDSCIEITSEFYDAVYQNRRDSDFYVNLAKSGTGPILELGCGTGRLSFAMATSGRELVGLEIVPKRIAMCRAKLKAAGASAPKLTFVEGDMRSFHFEQRFTLVAIPFRGFQHLLTPQDQAACLQTIHRHLLPGGLLVFDIFNPSVYFLADDSRFNEFPSLGPIELPSGKKVRLCERVAARDLFNQTQAAEEVYYLSDGDGGEQRFVDRYTTRYSFRFEMEYLLHLCGFEVEQVLGGLDGSPFGQTYPGELIFYARVPAV